MHQIIKPNDSKEMTDYRLVRKAINLSKNNKALEICFSKFVEHFGQIKELYKEGFDKSEALKEKVKNICKKSIFKLSNKEKNYFEGNYEFDLENNNQKN